MQSWFSLTKCPSSKTCRQFEQVICVLNYTLRKQYPIELKIRLILQRSFLKYIHRNQGKLILTQEEEYEDIS